MKKKRIFALTGAILLVSLYVATLVFAIIGNELAYQLLNASIFATIVIPVMLYAFLLVTGRQKEKED